MNDVTVGGTAAQPLVRAGTETGAMLDAILAAAQNPAMDVDKLRSLFELQERMQDRQAAQAYAAAMTAAQADMGPIAKDRHNEQTKSDYATLTAIDAAIRPVYTRHGFSLSFGSEDSTLADHVRIVCDVTHRDGHTKVYRYDNPMDGVGIAGKANKTATHARGSAVTYGRRYLTMLIFNLATGTHDDDGNGVGAGGDDDSAALISDWVNVLRECTTREELAARRVEMIDKLGHGDVNKVPGPVREAAVQRAKDLQ